MINDLHQAIIIIISTDLNEDPFNSSRHCCAAGIFIVPLTASKLAQLLLELTQVTSQGSVICFRGPVNRSRCCYAAGLFIFPLTASKLAQLQIASLRSAICKEWAGQLIPSLLRSLGFLFFR